MDPHLWVISFCASTKVQISTVNLSTRSEKNKGKRCPIFSQTLLNYECQKLQNLKFQDWQTLKIKPQVHFFFNLSISDFSSLLRFSISDSVLRAFADTLVGSVLQHGKPFVVTFWKHTKHWYARTPSPTSPLDPRLVCFSLTPLLSGGGWKGSMPTLLHTIIRVDISRKL